MKKEILIVLALLIAAIMPAYAVTTPTSFHFQAVVAGTRLCNATTGGSYTQLHTGTPANAPDAIVRNLGTTIVYFEIGTGGSGATAATVPTSSVGGSQAINPGEADLISKANADTLTCITASSTGTLSITPGTGN